MTKLTKESIEKALMEAGAPFANQANVVVEDDITWLITLNHWEPDLSQLNEIAKSLGIPLDEISVSGGFEDVTKCSCGRCMRDIESRLYIEIEKHDIPEEKTCHPSEDMG